jgi:hypothetical protein
MIQWNTAASLQRETIILGTNITTIGSLALGEFLNHILTETHTEFATRHTITMRMLILKFPQIKLVFQALCNTYKFFNFMQRAHKLLTTVKF